MIDHPSEPPLRRLVVSPRATAEATLAAEWYETQAIGLGAEFLRALDAVFAAVQREPERFARTSPTVRRALVRRFPYGVFFRERADRVVILGVIHARRDWRRWPSRGS